MNSSIGFERYTLELEPLTPIHIGSGQSFEGIDYAFREGANGQPPHIVCLDTDRFLREMNVFQAKAFQKKLDQGHEIAKWFRAQMKHDYDRYTIEVDKETAAELRAVVEDPAAEGEIHLLPRNAVTGTVYLPGSSLKGALRTAVVAAEAQRPEKNAALVAAAQTHRDQRRRSSAVFEAVALGHADGGRPNLYRDPFRQIMVSDLAPQAGDTRIQRIRIIRSIKHARQDSPDPGGIHMWREVTAATALGQSVSFCGELRLAPRLADQRLCGPDKYGKPTHLPLPLTWTTVRGHCNCFYGDRLIEELGNFQCEPSVAECLRSILQTLTPAECLVRVGRHSHFECVTIGEPFSETPQKGAGNTRSYAGGRVPLGWAIARLRNP